MSYARRPHSALSGRRAGPAEAMEAAADAGDAAAEAAPADPEQAQARARLDAAIALALHLLDLAAAARTSEARCPRRVPGSG